MDERTGDQQSLNSERGGPPPQPDQDKIHTLRGEDEA